MKENDSIDEYNDKTNIKINENEILNLNNKISLNFKEQRDIYDIFESFEIDKDDNNLKEISTQKINKDYSNNLIKLYKNIYFYNKKQKNNSDYPFFKNQNTGNFIPKLNNESNILNLKKLKEIHSNLPYYHQYKNFKLIYNMSKDGTQIKTLYNKSKEIINSILFIKDDNNCIFGSYISEELTCKFHEFYGTAETFLFTFYDTNKIHIYYPTRENDYYIYSDDKRLCFGCSDNKFSLCVENDFYNGYTGKTNTFDNELLSKKEKFQPIEIELYTFI